MIATQLLQVLVTVWVVGQPPISELLPRVYPATQRDSCEAKAEAVMSTVIREGVKAEAECISAPARAL